MHRLLIVEDEYMIRQSLTKHYPWAELGFEVCGTAGSGAEGLLLFKDLHPDAVLLDFRMPDMDGLEMLAGLREIGRSFFAVLLTGYKEFEIAQKAISLGVRAYLLKPVKRQELMDVFLALRSELDAEISAMNYPPYDPVLKPALDHIHQFYYLDEGIHDMAKMCGLSVAYFCRLFKQNTSMNFGDYKSVIRIEKAKDLLHREQLRIYEIADRVGFVDFRYFGRVFKLLEGMTPSEYRKQSNVQ